MKIAFLGSSLISSYWNGAATYYRGICKALHSLGHQVTFYEPDAYNRSSHRDIPNPEWAEVVIYSVVDVNKVLQAAKEADLVVKASGVGVLDGFLEQAVLEEKRPDSRVIFWDVDAPATLDRVQTNPSDPFRELIPSYDFILTYGGGEPVIEAYKALGARDCIPIYNALDITTHYAVLLDDRFQCDLAFLGNRLPDREERVEEFFFKPASQLPHNRFLLGGSGWDDRPLPHNITYLGHVPTHAHNGLNSTAKVVLNVSRASMAKYGFSPATRVFEAAGAGACILTDAWEGIELFLEPGREILVAQDGDEVVDCLQNLTLEKAHEIGRAARQRILAEHTYNHRAIQLEALLQ